MNNVNVQFFTITCKGNWILVILANLLYYHFRISCIRILSHDAMFI